MTTGELWTVILAAIGGNVALLSLVSYLLKTFIENGFKKQQARFEHDLSKSLTAFSQRHSIFCERQAEAMEEIYSRLWQVKDELYRVGCTRNLEALCEEKPKLEALHNQLATYFLHKRIYFTRELAKPIEELLLLLKDQGDAFDCGHRIDHKGQSYVDHINKTKNNTKEIEAKLNDVESNFRSVLSAISY